MNKVAFITGSAGFIGFHLSNNLLSNGWVVVGLDAMTDYYDVNLKKDRHELLKKNTKFYCYRGLVQDQELLNMIYTNHKPNIIIHLAAQPGVRYSIENPFSYFEANLLGTYHILELARKKGVEHLLIASTSSVYGNNQDLPYNENQKSDTPISFYAATKKSSETLAHSYSHLFSIPTTIFRFFTVYGPWGRPDMALFKFTKNILSGKPIDVYNYGNMKRDYTYVYDLVEAIKLLIEVKPQEPSKRKETIKIDSISNTAPYRIVNIGNSNSVDLMNYINELEKALGIIAKKNLLKMQDGELLETSSNTDLLKALTGYRPKTSLKEGILKFVNWYKNYYSIDKN